MFKENEICAAGLRDYFKNKPSDSCHADIMPDENEIEKCRKFIREYTEPHRHGTLSYELKHKVEKYCNNYISNGALIVAALREGCRVERYRLRSLNAIIRVSVIKEYRPPFTVRVENQR